MLLKILSAIAALIIIFLIIIATRPSEMSISRSITMTAPPSAPFAHVNDFHKWLAWSPYEKLDPALKRTYEGPTEGVGAIYRWAGNDQVGEGSMTILESKPGELIRIKLAFLKPMANECTADFVFKGEGATTTANWTMSGHNNFMCKAAGMFMNMDKMVGGQFEEGLASLKAVCKAAPKP